MASPTAPSAQSLSPHWRQDLLQRTLQSSLVLGTLTLVAVWPNNEWPARILFIAAWLVLALVTFVPLPYRLKAGIFLALLYILALQEFVSVGIRDNARTFLFAFTMMTLVFFSWRASVWSLAASIFTLTAAGVMHILGIALTAENMYYNQNWEGLADTVISFTLLGVMPLVGLNFFQRQFFETQERERAITATLREERNRLEAGVIERTAQLQAAADISRAASSIRNLDQLARVSVKLIQERFGLYWAGLLVLSEAGDELKLNSAYGRDGQVAVEEGTVLKVGSKSLIGWVAEHRLARVARDVADDPYYARHARLPETRSEVALPLLVGEKLLGVLDMQSNQLDAFSENNLAVLQTLADQLSVAVENAQLFEQSQINLSEVSSRYDQALGSAWQNASRHQPQEFTYELAPELAEADPSGTKARPIEIPLRIGNEVIGSIELHDRLTPLTLEEETALNTVTAQMSAALESASLFQEAQRRAEQLATASEVGRAATSVLNPDDLIVRAVDLIRERFNLYYVAIFMIDETGQWAELRYATGEAGRTLLDLKHRLEVGGQSMVGVAVSSGQARIAFDVGQEAVRFNNPYLPDTHSEMALPLVVGSLAIGALDVQSTDYAAFSEADITVLQTMADQLAVAIQNARQFVRTQQRVQFEQFINQFTTKLRQAVDTDSIMNVAMSELQAALGAKRVVAALGPSLGQAARRPAGQTGMLRPLTVESDSLTLGGGSGLPGGNGHSAGSNGHSTEAD